MEERLSQETKTCKYCNQERSIDDYPSYSPNKCKNCCKEYARNQWRKKHGKPLDDPILRGREKRPDFYNSIERKCCSCKETKSIKLFKRDPNIHGGYGYICKQCHNLREKTKGFARRHASHMKERAKKTKCHNLSLDQYNKMLLEQDGKCAACKQESTENDSSLAIDHDHMTGEIRGLLCRTCNLALGLLKDDPSRIAGLLEYIQYYTEML